MALIEELGLSRDLVEANAEARRRFVLRGGALVQVPDSPPALLRSSIISWPAKLRLLREPWAKAAPPHADETVFEFTERRLGREVAEVLVDTAVAGISAGDSRLLSVRSHFPILVEWERDHGGLFRALLARRKTAPRRPRLLSFARGLGTLPRTLADRLAPRVMTGRAITNISRHAQAWQVQLACGLSLPADQVVFATPASQTSAILRELDRELASELVERLVSHPGLDLCGTACDGVSFNHAIAAARRTGRSVAMRLLGEA